jgi:hypothetical protein
MKQYAYRPAAELVINVFQIYSNNYPEILKYCYIINGIFLVQFRCIPSNFYFSFLAPKIFSFAFSIVKKFLDEYTLSKINIYKQNRNKWLPAILERVDPSHLPKFYGGALTDSDGNPKCVEKICWGGKVPKSYYITEEDSYNNTTSYQTVVVKTGSKLKLDFEVEETGVYIK